PLIDDQAKWEESDLLQGFVQQQADVFGSVRGAIEQAELYQILGRDGERDGIANRLMEAIIGAVAEGWRLPVVGALVKVVTQFVVDGEEVFNADLDAHLEAQVVERVDVPGAGVAHYIAVARLEEQRALPESRGQRVET